MCLLHLLHWWRDYLPLETGEGNGTPLQYSGPENLWMEKPGRLQVHGIAKSRTRLHFHFHFPLSCIGAGNGNPLQCSCLENPRDGGAWWAAIYRVAQSQTWLKRLTAAAETGEAWESGLKKRNLFLTVLKVGNSRVRGPAWLCSGESSLYGLQMAAFLLCLYLADRELELSLWCLFC